MNRLKRYFRKSNPLIYPCSELEVWKDLKNEYSKFGYIWIELDLHHSVSDIRDADYKNMKKFKTFDEIITFFILIINCPV